MLKLDVQTLSKGLNYNKALDGVKLNQTGVINVTKENQKELTKYINIQTNSETGYEKIDLEKPINVGEVDMAKYGKAYYDILDNQGNKYSIDYTNNKVYEVKNNELKEILNASFDKENIVLDNGTKIKIEYALKEGIAIMIQKSGYDELGNPLENSKFDIYPNPNPYSKYTSVKELANNDKSLVSKKEQILTGIDIIDNSVEMFVRTDRSTKFMKVEDVLKQLDVILVTPNKEQLLSPGSYVAIETDKNSGQQFLSHGINCDSNGNPIGYSLKENNKQDIQNILYEYEKLTTNIIDENKSLKNENKDLLEKIKELEEQLKERTIA